MTTRREILAGAAVTALLAPAARAADAPALHGLIGSMTAQPGRRADLIAILIEGTGAMPGCLSYIVAEDPAKPDTIWITEVWDSAASHAASLKLPAVRAAIAKGRPLIAGFGEQTITRPLGGTGLSRPR